MSGRPLFDVDGFDVGPVAPKPKRKPKSRAPAPDGHECAEPARCETCSPFECDICGSRHTTYKNMRVHQNTHQHRDCKYCGGRFSANSISRHEKFCPSRHGSAEEDCDAVPIKHLVGTSSSQFRQACNFLEKCESIPRDPHIALVIFPDREPAFVRYQALASIMVSLAPNGASIIPTMALRTLTHPSDGE